MFLGKKKCKTVGISVIVFVIGVCLGFFGRLYFQKISFIIEKKEPLTNATTAQRVEKIPMSPETVEISKEEYDRLKKYQEKEAAEYAVKYAEFVIKYGSIILGVVALILIIMGFIYFYNFREARGEAKENLREIKDAAQEAEEIILSQKKIFEEFEIDAKAIFANAGIPVYLVPGEIYMGTREKKLSLEQEERLEDVIRQAYIYKNLLRGENSDLSEIFVKIGHYYLNHKKNYIRAQICYEYAIECFKRNKEAFFYKGLALLVQKKYERALKAFNAALEIDETYWRPYYDKGWVYDEFGEYEKAIEEYKKAENLMPNEDCIPYNIACSYSKWMKQKQAYDYLRRFIELKPANKKEALEDKDLKELFKDTEYGPKAKKLCT